ncbi:FkbM family methyltransferase [Flavobacterium sp. 25HG05S-40]|uniref:FkbM family methyltransferase n=1 Tax=Flavobacterium sp. 25HG05S-40 TaxID=3458682 RepID=UPI004044ECD6
MVKKQAVTLDSWAEKLQLPRLDFIKMDIEGAEIEALDGCVTVIQKYKPNFAIASYHIVNGQPTYIKVEEFFKKINYPFKTVTFRGKEIITFAGSNIK